MSQDDVTELAIQSAAQARSLVNVDICNAELIRIAGQTSRETAQRFAGMPRHTIALAIVADVALAVVRHAARQAVACN